MSSRFEMRKEPILMAGLDYLAALTKIWSNDEIRARHLITPLSVTISIAGRDL